MRKTYFFILFFMCLLFVQADDELLADKDVNRVMQQIFEKHVDKKQMTTDILRNSFKIYIEQFDPEKIYLLESEAAPYEKLSDAQMQQILTQYQNNDLSTFKKLNNELLVAIKRAQNYRQQFQKEELTVKPIEQIEYKHFAKDLKELQQRQRDHFAQFITSEQRRYGPAYVHNSYEKLSSYYDKKQRQFENQYLPISSRGVTLTDEEQQHQFLIHVLKALSRSLDAHTDVLDSTEAFDMRVRLNKGFDGIGIDVTERPEGVFVTHILKESPAERSGKIKLGDKIVKIAGQSVDEMDQGEVEEKLRGQTGTSVTLLLNRPGREGDFTVSLQRETIIINQGRAEVSYESFGNGIIGKIKLDSFYQGPNGISSVNDVKKAIAELDAKGNLRGLILDLRDNTGGYLSEAIKVAGLFITNGVIVISKYYNGEEHFYRDMDTTVTYDGPLIILTSRATASAAEIVAQALQDYGVAVVVGDDHTYGKGTIQSQTVTRENGSGSYFKVTVGKYYTVSGKTPQNQGVKVDVVVPGRYSQLQLGEEFLEYPDEKLIKNDKINAAYKDTLQDIQPELKGWYMRYYSPTLQKPRQEWGKVLPQLKKNSEYRLERNKNYKMFLQQLRGEKVIPDGDDEADEYGRIHRNNFGQDDLQMQEAVNIVKDMIYLQPQAENDAAIKETASFNK